MNRSTRPPRLRIPEAFNGPYSGVVIGTYGAYLPFAERELFRSLAKTTVNRIVLADATQLANHLDTSTDIRKLNRSYVAAGVTSPHAYHPKFVLLAGPESGMLLVGSGNLSVSGYTGPGECFATYRWPSEVAAELQAFAAIRRFTEQLQDLRWVDSVIASRLGDFYSSVPWIPHMNETTGPVRHNLDRSFLEQFQASLANRKVKELIAGAPFHDRGARALRSVLDTISPNTLTLLVQHRQTRLDKEAMASVIANRNIHFNLVEIDAPKPYLPTWLHAKILLARTSSGDVLLQGSPNLSTVALVEHGAAANVEVANLLEGPQGVFDSILEAIHRRPIRGGLTAFEPAEWDDSDDDELSLEPLVDTVTWSPPRLEGRLVAPLGANKQMRVLLGDRVLTPTNTSIRVVNEHTEFTLEFGEHDAARIDTAAGLRIEIGDVGTSPVIYPYHLRELMRLTSAGHRVELLQEAGALDLNDHELEELLEELDRVLIVDGRSLWRLAHPEANEPLPDDGEGPRIAYNELDWDVINSRPAFAQYGSASQRALLAPTELGIVLQALTDRFRAEARSALGDGAEITIDDDDLGLEPESEDEEELDEGQSPEVDDRVHRRQSARTRVRRLWRNFVGRFVRGLADDQFITSVGSSVIVPSYIVFNHLCRRLRAVDLIDPDFLTNTQVRLWTFMWGSQDHAGYLEQLPDDERIVAMQLLKAHDDLPAMIAAIDDAWWHSWESNADVVALRDFWRTFLSSDCAQLDREALRQAALVATQVGGDEKILLTDLADLAEVVTLHERDGDIATCLGTGIEAVREERGVVHRAGGDSNEEFLRVVCRLSPERASDAIAIWADFEPARTYFRLAAPNAVAIVDVTVGTRQYFDLKTGRESQLKDRSRPVPKWRIRLGELEAA